MPHTRPRGIHSSGLSFVVGGKLMKFTLSAQARGGPKGVGSEGQRPREREREREGERERKAVAGSTCCRVSASPCDLCAVTAPPTCIYAWKLLLHRPNISLLMFYRDTPLFGVDHLDLPKHFKSYRSLFVRRQSFLEELKCFYGPVDKLVDKVKSEYVVDSHVSQQVCKVCFNAYND